VAEQLTVGKHYLELLAPGLLYLRYEGDVSVVEAKEMSDFLNRHTANRSARIVTDLRKLGELGAEARRELAASRGPQDVEQQIELAFIGASLRTRVLMTVIIAAAKVIKSTQIESSFFATADQAWAWAGKKPMGAVGG
jgi:hypothetical protein